MKPEGLFVGVGGAWGTLIPQCAASVNGVEVGPVTAGRADPQVSSARKR